MALVRCNECGSSVSTLAKTCMQCGQPIHAYEYVKFSRSAGWVAIAIAVVGFSYMFYDPTGYNDKGPAAPVHRSAAERKDIVAKATAGLEAKVLDEQRTQYAAPVPAIPTSGLGAYVAVDNGKQPILFVAPVYVGVRPISFKLINVTVNGVMAYKKAFLPTNVERAKSKALSIESTHFVAQPIELEILKRVVASDTAVITFHGKGKPREHIVTREQVAELKAVIDAYDRLKATL